MREALRLMEDRDRMTDLKAAIAIGDEQHARGEVAPWSGDLMERLKQEGDEADRLGLPIGGHVGP